ncbi:MAG: AarF/UbiB family protein [Myxococcota bacterium]
MDAARDDAVSEPTWVDPLTPGEGAPAAVATVGHGRYRLGEVLGCGGFGQVHRALDTLTGEEVAVKLVAARSAADLARARRELAALRWLRMPGVVRLRDDGVDGTSWFMVLDLVPGRHFDARLGWDAIRAPTLELLEILARVHLAGVLHLDLKPGNLIVTPEGRVVVLDFGIARGRAVPLAGTSAEGSPRYAAPEQRRGEPCDARADLYAVATMVLEGCPDLPDDVLAVFRAMHADDPADRPASALEAYRALAGRSPLPPALDREAPWAPDALEALFAGPDRFTHLAQDAAALLWDRTGGDPVRVRDEVERWILGGQASWSDAGLLVDRIGLEQLADALPTDLLQGDVEALAEGAVDAARDLVHRGRIAAAMALLDAVLPLAPDLQAELLDERVVAALADGRPAQLDLALHALERATQTAEVRRLGALVRMVRAVQRGERGPAREAEAALLAGAVDGEAFDDPALEDRFQGFRLPLAALDGVEAEQAQLDALAAWAAGDAERQGLLEGWRGQHAYRAGRYADAARAQERAAAAKSAPLARLSSTLGAAAAWLEVPDLDRAEALAAAGAAQALALRHPRYEAHATWMVRTAAYRAGRALAPDPAFVDAAAPLGADLEAALAATEAAAAWRAGHPPPPRSLPAPRPLRRRPQPGGAAAGRLRGVPAGRARAGRRPRRGPRRTGPGLRAAGAGLRPLARRPDRRGAPGRAGCPAPAGDLGRAPRRALRRRGPARGRPYGMTWTPSPIWPPSAPSAAPTPAQPKPETRPSEAVSSAPASTSQRCSPASRARSGSSQGSSNSGSRPTAVRPRASSPIAKCSPRPCSSASDASASPRGSASSRPPVSPARTRTGPSARAAARVASTSARSASNP